MRKLAETPSERPQQRTDVPEVVVARLPQYVRVLNTLLSDGVQVANSQMLGEKLQVTPAQIRKDLSYFGRFAKHLGTRHLSFPLQAMIFRQMEHHPAYANVQLAPPCNDISSAPARLSNYPKPNHVIRKERSD